MVFFLGFMDGVPKTPADIKTAVGGEFIIPDEDFIALEENKLFRQYFIPMIRMMRDQYADRQKAN